MHSSGLLRYQLIVVVEAYIGQWFCLSLHSNSVAHEVRKMPKDLF